MIVASSIGLGEILLDGADVYWLEIAAAGGRALGARAPRRGRDDNRCDPADAGRRRRTFNVRTRVHEYGGGAYLVDAGTVYFCNDADQRLYRQRPGAAPMPITPEPGRPRGLRYADGVMDPARGRMIWVREDHTTDAPRAGQHAGRDPARRAADSAGTAGGPRLLRRTAPQPRTAADLPGSNGTTR